MTVEDLLKDNEYNPALDWRNKVVTIEAAQKMMIEYAKYHVENMTERLSTCELDLILDWNPYSDNFPKRLNKGRVSLMYDKSEFK